MSLPRVGNRKASDSDRSDTSNSAKKKLGSEHTGRKNGTHEKKRETSGQPKPRRKSSVPDRTISPSKSDIKKHSVADVHTKTTHAAGSTHTNGTTKSHKTATPSRSDIHGKTGAQSTTKKAEVNKPRTNKKPEQDKNEPEKDDPELDDHTETDDTITTAVSQNLESVSDDKPDNAITETVPQNSESTLDDKSGEGDVNDDDNQNQS